MKHLGFSVGGTRIAGLLGSAIAIKESGYKPNVLSGNSAGSIVALLYAMDLLEEGKEIMNNFNSKVLFSLKPFSFLGIVYGIGRAVLGKKSINKMKLKALINKVIIKSEFERYKFDKNSSPVYVGAVSIKDGSKVVWNIKNYSYDQAMNMILASCSIPGLTEPVFIDNNYYVDGGLRDFIVSNDLYDMLVINESITVYSKPFDDVILDGKKKLNFTSIVANTFDILMTEIAKEDQVQEIRNCIRLNIKLRQIFLPSILKGIFDDDPTRLKELFFQSYTITNNKLKNDF